MHSTRGFFAYQDELSAMSATMNTSKMNGTISSRLEAGNRDDSQEYLNLYQQDSSFQHPGNNSGRPTQLSDNKMVSSRVAEQIVENEESSDD